MKKPDNICRLRYRLEKKENDRVEFQILEMDEELRATMINKDHGIHNKWDIWSCASPCICTYPDYELFIRGTSREMDDSVDVFVGHHLIPSIHKAFKMLVKSKYGQCKVIKG